MSYRGGTIPKRQTKQMRKLLSDLNEIATRGSDTPRKASTGAGTNTQPGNIQPILPNVIYNEDSSAGTISSIPVAPAGTLRITRYSGNPKFAAGGNLDLAGPSFQADPNGLVAWMSNGNRWRELSRGPGAETFVPVRRYGALPGIASDQTSKVQAAFDNAPAGSVLVFEAGDYIINGVSVTRDNLSIFLPPGAVLRSTAQTPNAIFYVNGALDTTTTKDVVVNPGADAAFPRGGDRTIFVAPGDEAAFAVDGWLTIEDTESVPGGLSADAGYQLEHHMEIARIKAKSSGRLDLYAPLVNSYTNVGGIPPKLRVTTPVQNFRIWGGGTIQNVTTPGAGTSHGVQLRNVVGAVIENITLEQCFNSGVHLVRAQEVRIAHCTFRDPPRFDSRGYGVTMYGGIRVEVVCNNFKRLRHCTDVSFFSRLVSVTGNSMAGSTTGNVITHPCVEGLSIVGNVIDGGHGQEAVAPSFEYGDSAAQASGINIDQMNKSVSIVGNTIRNMRLSGIYVDTGSTNFPAEFITISGNTIENCCTFRRISPGGITQHAGIAIQENSVGGTDRRGIIVTGNVLREPGPYGILAGISNMLIANNWIYKAEDKMIAGTPPVVGIGIWIKPSAAGVPRNISVKGNICTSCKQNGIRAGVNAGTAIAVPVIESNYCSDNGGDGIFLEEICVNPMINYNICWNNGGDGINNQSPGGFIVGNRLSSNTGVGIRLIAGADNNLVKDNIFEGTGTKIVDAAASTFYMYLDDVNDRYGIGTATPGRRVEISGGNVCGSTPQLKFSGQGSAIAEIGAFDDCSYGGGAFQINPSGGSAALNWIHLFGTSESTAIAMLDDGTDYWPIRTTASRNIRFNCASGKKYEWNQNFDVLFSLMGPSGVTGAANFFIPSTYSLLDTSNNTVLTPLIIGRGVKGGGFGAAGIGERISWALFNSVNTPITASEWDVVLDVATSGAEDSSIRFKARDNNTIKELVRFDGANQKVQITAEDAGTIGTAEILKLQRATTGTAANTFGAHVSFFLEQDAGLQLEAARIGAVWEDVRSGQEDSSIIFRVQDDSNLHELMRLRSPDAATPELIIHNDTITQPQIRLFVNGAGTFNEQGNDADFRVEGDTEVNLLFCDASADTVQIASATTADSAKFYVNGKLSTSGEAEINGALNHDGSTVGFYGVTPVVRSSAYTPTNVTTDRSYDADATTLDEVADVLGTLIADLQLTGIIA